MTSIMRDILIVRNEWFDGRQFTELFTIGQGLLEPTLV
jgi:chromate transport protein ChrA